MVVLDFYLLFFPPDLNILLKHSFYLTMVVYTLSSQDLIMFRYTGHIVVQLKYSLYTFFFLTFIMQGLEIMHRIEEKRVTKISITLYLNRLEFTYSDFLIYLLLEG